MHYLPDCIDVQYMKFFSISFSQNKTTLSIKCMSIPKKSLHQSFWTLYLIIVILKHLFNVMDQVHNSYMIYCSKDTLFERHQLIKTYLIFCVNHVFITSQTQKYSRHKNKCLYLLPLMCFLSRILCKYFVGSYFFPLNLSYANMGKHLFWSSIVYFKEKDLHMFIKTFC